MEYVQPIGAAADAPYLDANPVGGAEGSPVPAAAIEHPMRELVALITDAGIAPAGGTLTQLRDAVRRLIQRQAPAVSAAGGTADAITGIFTPAITALTDGMTVHVRAGAANATTTPTFTPAAGTIAAKVIVKGNDLPLAAGDIIGAGFWIDLKYDVTLDKWLLVNPAKGLTAQDFASAAETQAGLIANKAVTPSGLAESMIGGIGQTWQDVGASRVVGVTYTNTTGRAIMVNVAKNTSSAGNLSVGGQLVGRTDPTSDVTTSISAIVPHGMTYVLTGAFDTWYELR